ncbi:hypothetical protein [Ectopseudomonas oleovorans]|uniref:hypothetical protein n=1 Tax=Ectopseudomonas oleovorans TaxID=301 RepID=UPI0012DFECCB|nr:hypothetical protein [Pseudomonas oleovorans]
MISEEEFREMQEEMDEMRDAIDRLAAMNEALQEALFAALQSTPVRQELFASLIDRTLDQWLLQRRQLDSDDSLFLRRVRDDVLAKLPEGSLGFPPAKPRPALRAVPVLRPNGAAPKPGAVPTGAGHAPRPGGTPPDGQPLAPHGSGDESHSGKDE